MKEKRKDILITAILSILIIIAAAFIIGFRNLPIGKKILDSLAIIGGAFQTVIAIVIFNNVQKSYLKIIAFILIMIGLAMFVIHLIGVTPVYIWKFFGIR